MRHVLALALLVLSIVMPFVAGCSSGGGGSQTAPTPNWSTFQHDSFRTGLTSGAIRKNLGTFNKISKQCSPGATLSSPAISRGGIVYVGTPSGLLALTTTGIERWRFEGYSRKCLRSSQPCQTDADCSGGSQARTRTGDTCNGCAACDPGTSGCEFLVGPVSASPTVAESGDLVFGSDRGQVFGLGDRGDTFACKWVARAEDQTLGPVRSSAGVVVSTVDSTITSAFVGTDEGFLLALNGSAGTLKWRFPLSGSLGAITSSPAVALDGSSFFTTPGGLLQALSPTGNPLWSVQVSHGEIDASLLPSPALGPSVYATGNDGVVAVTAAGSVKWRFQTDQPVLGSPVLAQETVTIPSTATVTPGPSPSPTPTTVLDTVVFAVDQKGTLYGIRDGTGQEVGRTPIDDTQPTVRSSPTISTDLFVVVVGDDGRLYASNLDGSPPCESCEGENQWPGGIDVGAEIRSSPVINADGTIYVTAADGCVYAIGPPLS